MLKTLKFTYNVFMSLNENFTVTLSMNDNHEMFTKIDSFGELHMNEAREVDAKDCKEIIDLIDSCCLETWYKEYHPEGCYVFDGFCWKLEYEDQSEIIGMSTNKIEIKGDNAYPWCFYLLIRAILIANPEFEEVIGGFAKEKVPVYE